MSDGTHSYRPSCREGHALRRGVRRAVPGLRQEALRDARGLSGRLDTRAGRTCSREHSRAFGAALASRSTGADRGAAGDADVYEFASEWFERQKLEGGRRGEGLTAAGTSDLEWRLSYHLLPFFKSIRLDAITVEDVDRFRLAKVRERDAIDKAAAKKKPLMETYTDRAGRTGERRRTALGAGSINKLIGTLSRSSKLRANTRSSRATLPEDAEGGSRRQSLLGHG